MTTQQKLDVALARLQIAKRGLKEIGSGFCCGTPGCTPDDPMCDVKMALGILKEMRNVRKGLSK